MASRSSQSPTTGAPCPWAERSPTPRRLTTSCARCAPRSWCWVRCWRGWARLGSRCPAAARSAPGPIDLHLKGLEQLGARILLEGGYIDARVDGRLQGRDHRVPVRLRRCNRKPADGGLPGRGPHRAGQRGPRTGDRRPGRLSGRDGRAHRGHRQRQADDRGRRCAAWRTTRHHSRSHRDRQLCLRRRDLRRVRFSARCATGSPRRHGAHPARGRCRYCRRTGRA